MKFYRKNVLSYDLFFLISCIGFLSVLLFYTTVASFSREDAQSMEVILFLEYAICSPILIFCILRVFLAPKEGILLSNTGFLNQNGWKKTPHPYSDIWAIVIVPTSFMTRYGVRTSTQAVSKGGKKGKETICSMFLVKKMADIPNPQEISHIDSMHFVQKYRDFILGEALYHPECVKELIAQKQDILVFTGKI